MSFFFFFTVWLKESEAMEHQICVFRINFHCILVQTIKVNGIQEQHLIGSITSINSLTHFFFFFLNILLCVLQKKVNTCLEQHQVDE